MDEEKQSEDTETSSELHWWEKVKVWTIVIVITFIVYMGFLCYLGFLMTKGQLNSEYISLLGAIIGSLTCFVTGFGVLSSMHQQNRNYIAHCNEQREARKEAQRLIGQYKEQTDELNNQVNLYRWQTKLYESQSRYDDIHRRLSLIYELESNVEYEKKNWLPESSNYSVPVNYKGRKAIESISISALYYVDLISTKKELSDNEQKSYEVRVENISASLITVQPVLNCLAELLADINTYFSNDEENKSRFLRIVLNVFPAYTWVLLCLYREYTPNKEVVESLMNKMGLGKSVETLSRIDAVEEFTKRTLDCKGGKFQIPNSGTSIREDGKSHHRYVSVSPKKKRRKVR